MIDSVTLKVPYLGNINRQVFQNEKARSTLNQWRVRTLIPVRFAKYKSQQIYAPVVWIEQRRYPTPITEVCIQVSLPKLCHNSNYYALTHDKIDYTLIKLSLALKAFYDLDIAGQYIKAARVCRIDFSIQFQLPAYLGDAQDIINFLYAVAYRPRTEIIRRDIAYGKAGYWLKFYNKSQSITFYDKFLELQNTGFTKEDELIVKELLSSHQSSQILRYEIALFNSESIRRMAMRCKLPKKRRYLLSEIIDADLPQKCLRNIIITTYNKHADHLYFLERDKLRQQVRNFSSYNDKAILYFLIEEIRNRGQKVVWDEICLLRGKSYTARMKRVINLFLHSLEEKELFPCGPLQWMLNELKIKKR